MIVHSFILTELQRVMGQKCYS